MVSQVHVHRWMVESPHPDHPQLEAYCNCGLLRSFPKNNDWAYSDSERKKMKAAK